MTRLKLSRIQLLAIAVGLTAGFAYLLLVRTVETGLSAVVEEISRKQSAPPVAEAPHASPGDSGDVRTRVEDLSSELDLSSAATLVLEGVLQTRTGDSPGRCLMIVNHPHRDHLDPSARGRGSVHHLPDKNGHFAIALPSPPFVDTAAVTVTGGPEGDTTLLHAVVGIGSGHAIQVLSPSEIQAASIRGSILVAGSPVEGGDLVLRTGAGRPLSVQWGLAGNELKVSLRRLREDLARVVGPVCLFLQDDPGLHWEREFFTTDDLRNALEVGIQAEVHEVVLEFDAGRHHVERLRLGSCRNNDFAKDHSVEGARASVRLSAGRYFFELVCDGGMVHGVGSFAFDGAASSIRPACDAWEPGSSAVDVLVRDARAHGVAQAGIRMRRLSGSGDALPTVVHEQATDASGLARLTGLAPGVYDLEVSHPEHARQSLRIRVADAPEPQVAEVSMHRGNLVLLELVLPRGQATTRVSSIAYRPAGRSWWTPVEVGPGSDLVVEGIPTGSVEFLAVGQEHVGSTSSAVGEGQCRTSIVLEQKSLRTVRLVDARGTAARQVSVTLDLAGGSGDWSIHGWPVDADGRVAFFSLGIAGEKFVVRHRGRSVIALDPSFVPEVLTVADLEDQAGK